MSAHDGQETFDVLEQATGALRGATVPEGPPPRLVASTLEALQSLNTAPDVVRRQQRRRIMFRIARYGGLAAAVVLLSVAAAALWLLDRSAGPAFADVVENVKKAKAVNFTVWQKLTPESAPLEQRFYLQGDAMRMEIPGTQESFRAEEPVVLAIIADLKAKKALQLDFVRKTYKWIPMDKVVAKQFVSPIDQLRQLKNQDPERIGDEELDGRKVQVYRLKKLDVLGAKGKLDKGESAKLWVDPRSGLPVRMVLEFWNTDHKGKTVIIFKQFTWNEPLAPELFRLEVPKGFTVQQE